MILMKQFLEVSLKVSIPKRVLEALKPPAQQAADYKWQLSVSIPKRVLEALKL